jgi:hypothetical protein
LVSRTAGSDPAASRSRSTSPAPTEGSWVHVADEQQVRARRDRLDQLVGQDHVDHRGLVDHHQVRVEGFTGVEGRVPAGAELQQPVDGGRVVAG